MQSTVDTMLSNVIKIVNLRQLFLNCKLIANPCIKRIFKGLEIVYGLIGFFT